MFWGRREKKTDVSEAAAAGTQRTVGDFSELAQLYFVAEQYAAAVKVYLDGLKCFPNDISLLYNLGMTYLALNDQTKAAETFRKVLEIAPTNKEAQEALSGIIHY